MGCVTGSTDTGAASLEAGGGGAETAVSVVDRGRGTERLGASGGGVEAGAAAAGFGASGSGAGGPGSGAVAGASQPPPRSGSLPDFFFQASFAQRRSLR